MLPASEVCYVKIKAKRNWCQHIKLSGCSVCLCAHAWDRAFANPGATPDLLALTCRWCLITYVFSILCLHFLSNYQTRSRDLSTWINTFSWVVKWNFYWSKIWINVNRGDDISNSTMIYLLFEELPLLFHIVELFSVTAPYQRTIQKKINSNNEIRIIHVSQISLKITLLQRQTLNEKKNRTLKCTTRLCDEKSCSVDWGRGICPLFSVPFSGHWQFKCPPRLYHPTYPNIYDV